MYLQRHPGKALEILRYMDIVRLAYTKWGGMAWRAYDEQFRALVAVYPKCWSIIDHNLWSLCVRALQTISISKTLHPSAPSASGSGPKKVGFQKGGHSGNNNNKGGEGGNQKGGLTTTPGEGQSVGTTKWMYVGDTTANSPTYVRGAGVPI
jgi:hypothetical protein